MGLETPIGNFFRGGERPLDRCLEWTAAAEKAGGGRYVVMAHETPVSTRSPAPDVVREYEAIKMRYLSGWWNVAKRPMHAHEVIREGPTTLYGDIDVPPHHPAAGYAELLAHRFLEVLSSTASSQFGVSCEPVILDASKDGKFSRHFSLRLSDANGPVAFAGAADVLCFIAKVQDSLAEAPPFGGAVFPKESFCDLGVYRRNGTLRTYGSTKYGQSRPFRLLGDQPGTPFAYTTFIRSLVSVAPAEKLRLLSLSGSPSLKRPRDSAASPAPMRVRGSYEAFAIARNVPDIVDAGLRSASVTPHGWIVAACKSKFCNKKGDRHEHSTIYFLIDVDRHLYRQACHASGCRMRPDLPWLPLPGASPVPTSSYGFAAAATLAPNHQ